MGKPVPRARKFGAFLEKTRGGRSRASVTTQLASFGIVLDQSALSKYEKEGRVPPIDVVRGLALAYRKPFTELVDMLLKEQDIEAVDWQKEMGGSTYGLLQLTGAGKKDATAERIPDPVSQYPEAQLGPSLTPTGKDLTSRGTHDHHTGDSAGAPFGKLAVYEAGLASVLTDVIGDIDRLHQRRRALARAAAALVRRQAATTKAHRARTTRSTGTGARRTPPHRGGKR